MKIPVRPACYLRSWQYEIAGVIGLSASVNIFTSLAASGNLPLCLSLLATFAWLGFGVMTMWLSVEFRVRETYETTAASVAGNPIDDKELSKRLRIRFEDNSRVMWVISGVVVSFLVSIALSVLLIWTRV